MKTLNLENLNDFVLSNEEMINVRGGGSPTDPQKPPVVIIVSI